MRDAAHFQPPEALSRGARDVLGAWSVRFSTRRRLPSPLHRPNLANDARDQRPVAQNGIPPAREPPDQAPTRHLRAGDAHRSILLIAASRASDAAAAAVVARRTDARKDARAHTLGQSGQWRPQNRGLQGLRGLKTKQRLHQPRTVSARIASAALRFARSSGRPISSPVQSVQSVHSIAAPRLHHHRHHQPASACIARIARVAPRSSLGLSQAALGPPAASVPERPCL